MEEDQLYFETVKHLRESYIVEYSPPNPGCLFSILTLAFLKEHDEPRIQAAMKKELELWIKKYPVPIMVSAFDSEDCVISVHPQGSHLVGWVNPENLEIEVSWNLQDLESFTKERFLKPNWEEVFFDIPFKTKSDLKEKAAAKALEQAKSIKVLRWIGFTWFAIIPISWIIIQLLGPFWIGLAVSVYAGYKALSAGLKILGVKPPSKKDLEVADLRRKKEHYIYHCELNPEGFARLKAENFSNQAKEGLVAEAESLKSKVT